MSVSVACVDVFYICTCFAWYIPTESGEMGTIPRLIFCEGTIGLNFSAGFGRPPAAPGCNLRGKVFFFAFLLAPACGEGPAFRLDSCLAHASGCARALMDELAGVPRLTS